ncbi:TetR/AcrR family transcriptional regulator [Aliarcobacter butzleri]|uniref:TetR/AcrR family transcriptional regulator n=1 Tax=Aliarcobacter butzleri TaxID=28197 RepID=UPI0012F866BD|nr:TetR/AcrR family transcriptional regulator [Aliarcobacter butzleri]
MKSKVDERVNEIKKEMYLKASAEYIDNNGYKQLKISELAKNLEISVGTIYNLFGSKEDLYLEYLILKLKNFLDELISNETNDAVSNLKLYLNAKYRIFIQIDRDENYPIINDPFFFHKLDVINHPIVNDIYAYLKKQFELLFPNSQYDYYHLTILFKKFSDGFIESYLLKKYDNENIVDETIDLFLKMFK